MGTVDIMKITPKNAYRRAYLLITEQFGQIKNIQCDMKDAMSDIDESSELSQVRTAFEKAVHVNLELTKLAYDYHDKMCLLLDKMRALETKESQSS